MEKQKDERGERLREYVKILPAEPGVYRFLDKEGNIIYIGKAKNLRNRVSQYFHSPLSQSPKTRVMVSKIESIQHTVVENEEDAFLLENNLIKQFLPRYNVMLKDSKSYPWICIKNEPFPRVMITRKFVRDGSVYFGPYSSAYYAHSLVELISSLFYLRNCKLSLTQENIKTKKWRPCLNYHIGKCKAPCAGKISQEEYEEQLVNIKLIIRGESSSIIKHFREKMFKAASDLRFEEAQKYKEKLEVIDRHYSKSLVVSQTITNVDVFTLAFENNLAFGNFIRVVNGSIIHSLNLEFRLAIEEDPASVLSLFIAEIRSKSAPLSPELIVPYLPDSGFAGCTPKIPLKGEKLKLLELSLKNANLFKSERLKQEEMVRPLENKKRALEALARDLNLPRLPLHIECFDNSNIQGKYAVAACVVFKDGFPSKKDYRHFNIKKVAGANDFATMKEVVNRRYSRVLTEKSPLPDLVVVDGGKGQLNFAREALSELDLEDKIFLVGIAKRMEELFIPGDPDPLFLDKNSASLRLIMQMRDEAHRFGITHHRNLRSKGQLPSALSGIKGIGTKSEQILLSRYKSLAAIRKAPAEEIEKLIGKRGASLLRLWFEQESSGATDTSL
ncbi:MAG: excinuclease ABC subunit UvrC [Bacteroidales bacterium]|nr:excinuclease ABC subunit UvrC [Bacteroidales bacterium]MDD2426005.1 excinuclease ABC subunit UvrC [Bacteroidales bacterium]MDD3989631.1 excinuclease ABC subunit UvrC [Bacteroidales bacterium]MDD4638802.1 excinuclease ABC subunit UvrC [Bacteroidales bacterium]